MLIRTGVVRSAASGRAVVFDRERCPGCDGRCALQLGGTPRLALDIDLPDGTPVEVAASAPPLARRALAVFGIPLATTIAAAVIANWPAWGDWLVPAALLGSALAMIVGRFALAGKRGAAGQRMLEPCEGPACPRPPRTVRIRLI